MYVADIELHSCTTLDEASELLRRLSPGARLLAGGTELLVDLKTGRSSAKHLVSLGGVKGLRGVSLTEDGLRIGALTTLSQLDRSPIVREHFTAIRDATGQMAAVQIRNAATVGGNVVCAVPCADLPPVFSVLDASVLAWSPSGERRIKLDSFYLGVRKTVLRVGEVLTAIIVPRSPRNFGAAYARFALREGNAVAVASVAAGLQFDRDGKVQDVRITLGAVSPIPKRVKPAEAALRGRRIDDAALSEAAEAAMRAAEPISDVRGSAEFRRELLGVLTRRALLTARDRAAENKA